MLVQRIRFDTPAYYHGRERAVAEYPDFTPTRVGHGAGVSRSALHARSVSVDLPERAAAPGAGAAGEARLKLKR